MTQQLLKYGSIVWQMLKADIVAFKPLYQTKIINMSIYVIILLVLSTYLIPGTGGPATLGIFTAVTIGVLPGMMEVYSNAMEFIIDSEGNKVILYQMSLPLPYYFVLLKNVLYYFYINLVVGAVTMPLALFVVSHKINWALFSPTRYFIIFIIASFFFAVFSLFCSSLVGGVRTLSSLWMRFVFPLWFLGGFQFSWLTLHTQNTFASYLALLNPFLFVTEGARAAGLGQEGSLNYLICLAVIIFYTCLCWIIAVRRLRQKLNCI